MIKLRGDELFSKAVAVAHTAVGISVEKRGGEADLSKSVPRCTLRSP